MASYVGQVTIGSASYPIGSMLYGECTTAVGTAAKEVNNLGLTNFDTLAKGVTIYVKFTNGNSAAAPTLKVGSTDALSIVGAGALTFAAGAIVAFTYDEQSSSDKKWRAHDIANYAIISEANAKSTSHTTGSLITGQRLNAAITSQIQNLDVNNISGFGAGKTLATLTETDGKIAATFQNISITKSQVSDFPTLGTAAVKNVATSAIVDSDSNTDLTTRAQVATYVAAKTAGLTGAMHFKGSIASLPTATDSSTYSAYAAGDVVLVGKQEYVYNKGSNAASSSWVLLGDEGSYALNTITVTGSNGLTGGGAISSNQIISHASRPATSATADATFGNATSRYYIKQIKVDSYGHIIDVTTGNETVTNSDAKVTQSVLATSVTDTYPLLVSNYKTGVTTTTAAAANRVQAIYVQPSTGTLFATKFSGDGSSLTNVAASSVALASVTGADDLKAIEALSGTSGFLKKTAADTWTLDTNTYLTSQYATHLYITNSSGTAKTTAALTNGNVYLKLYDSSTARESYKVVGAKGIEVISDTSGNLTVQHTHTDITAKTAYGSTATTASANGGKIIVTDVQYDAQGHITAAKDRTITLSQKTYSPSKNNIYPLADANYLQSASVASGTLTITAGTSTAKSVVVDVT